MEYININDMGPTCSNDAQQIDSVIWKVHKNIASLMILPTANMFLPSLSKIHRNNIRDHTISQFK